MSNFMFISMFILCLMITGCQNTSILDDYNQAKVNSLLLDNEFPNHQYISIESPDEIFELDDEMKMMVEKKLKPERNSIKKTKKLLKHIFDVENIALTYSSNANITAIQAYHQHAANCLSLTIMAYALAKEANLEVSFQEVEVPEYWVRHGRYSMLTGHVNLVVKPSSMEDSMSNIVWGGHNMQIDFDPFTIKPYFNRKLIGQHTVLAMFYNNKAAQALVDLDYTKAYRYFKAAINEDPNFSPTWGNLGFLYRLTHHDEQAKNVYRYAISINEDNLTALGNLAIILASEGNVDEVKQIENQLLEKRIKNPYYHALLADESFFHGDYQQAISHYKRAIRLDKKVHEFYYSLSKAYYQMNDIIRAKSAMNRAIALNPQQDIEEQYIAKLNFLKTAGTFH